MLILTQLFLELNILGGLPDAVLAHAYCLLHRILPGLLSILTGLLFQYCGLFQVQNMYEIMLRRRFLSFLLPTIFD